MLSFAATFWLTALGVATLTLQMTHLIWVMRWSDRQTDGLEYYGRPASVRERFQHRLQRHAFFLTPIRWLLGYCGTFRFESGTFHYRNVPAPKAGSCSEASFRKAEQYKPRAEDVFVVTQMRSGTTWMQHLVFQVLSRGTRDLAREDVCLNAISPWLESHKGIAVDAAPLIGAGSGQSPPSTVEQGSKVPQRKRIIKTHLPASLCPYDERAKYIYVVRHPVSCFASCVDFVRSNLRGFEPSWEACFDWFTSAEKMWWGTWWDHWHGWSNYAESANNILFVRFEDMKADLPSVIRQVADFLEIDALTDADVASVAHRCGFEYMQTHAHVFEMHPPHLLQTPQQFFVRGRTERDTEIPERIREGIVAICQSVYDRGLPVERFYPELIQDLCEPVAVEASQTEPEQSDSEGALNRTIEV